MDIDKVIRDATLEEKLSLLAGWDLWHTSPLPRLLVPSIGVSDGPNGVRGHKFFNGEPSTCLPCGTGLGATWNTSLLHRAGQLIAEECIVKDAQVWLGPTVNIQRSPLGGRGFESFSEDPYLSGKLAATYVRGVQENGVCAVMKHFVCNDMEEDRKSVDVRVSERALREIYLLPFQLAVAEAQPAGIMAAYNKVNGVHCSENRRLLHDILRQEWDHKGIVMSDWFGTYSFVDSLSAGLELEMPGKPRFRTPAGTAAIASSRLHHKVLDARLRTQLELVQRASKHGGVDAKDAPPLSDDEKRALNLQLACESVVLLKNDRNILPLANDGGDIAVIGPNAKFAAICGGGSASLDVSYRVTPFEAIKRQAASGTKLYHEIGAYSHVLIPIFDSNTITSTDGKPGALVRFYREPHTTPNRVCYDEVVIRETNFQLMDYVNPKLGDTYYATLTANFTPEVSGRYDFGLAVYGTALLYVNDDLVIDNCSKQVYGGLFFGHGTREERDSYYLEAGKTYEIRLEFGNSSTSKIREDEASLSPGGACRLGGCLRIDPEDAIEKAVALAKRYKHTIVVAGLNGDWETEGHDRTTMDLPVHVSTLVTRVLAARPDAIIVTQSGTPVTMPWADTASTLVHSWLSGNEVGTAIAAVIFGSSNPSGKLPLTFPRRIEDTPAYTGFGNDSGAVVYGEDIYVGYRWYEKRKLDVAFPFGHGLSYTTFALHDPAFGAKAATVTLKNTGTRFGGEVVMLYVARVSASGLKIQRPVRELKGFEKVFLKPGERHRLTLAVDKYTTASWHRQDEAWVNEEGTWEFSLVAGAESVSGLITLDASNWWSGV